MASTGGTGRYTPKKSAAPQAGGDDKAASLKAKGAASADEPAYRSSGRYTAPIPKEVRESPSWVPYVMFGLLIAGLITIIANYMNLLPGDANNWYLLLGLGFITGGFISATQLR